METRAAVETLFFLLVIIGSKNCNLYLTYFLKSPIKYKYLNKNLSEKSKILALSSKQL